MKTLKVISYTSALVAVGALVFGAVYLRGVRAAQHEQVEPPVQTPWALHSTLVKQGTITSGFMALATKKADSEILIASQISGTITSMGPREGETFQPGTILARIDATQINDEIDALKANLMAAKQQEKFLKKELERQNKLFQKGFTTMEKTENARTNFIAAKEKVSALNHQLAQLKTRRSYAVITTDKSGTVAARLAEPGNLAAPGKPIYRLTVSGKTRFTIRVPQSVLKDLRVGGLVELKSGDNIILEPVTRINRTLDNLSMGSIDIDLAASPFKLPTGARVPARVITAQVKNALSVPITAIAFAADGKSGFVIKVTGKNEKATLHKISVKVIQSSSDGAAIKGDVNPGDRVVIAQQAVLLKLQSGDPATIAKGMNSYSSFLDPIAIMASLPLAVIGAVWAMMLADKHSSMPSFMGFILLMGIAVNNGILLIDFTKEAMKKGKGLKEALIQSVELRTRPILMTATASSVGMLPIAMEWSVGIERLSPLAVVAIGGLMVGTFLTLVAVPVFYYLLHRGRSKSAALFGHQSS